MATENPQIVEAQPNAGRAEIDTSAPFESVKEAATLFGGMGFWKPVSHKPSQHASQVLFAPSFLVVSSGFVFLHCQI